MLFYQPDLHPGEENKAVGKGRGNRSGMGWDCEVGKASWRRSGKGSLRGRLQGREEVLERAQMEPGGRERPGLPARALSPGSARVRSLWEGPDAEPPAPPPGRAGGRLQGGAGLARPPGDAALAALRPGSAGLQRERDPGGGGGK